MTPKLLNKLSIKIDPYEKKLPKIGLILVLLFCGGLMINLSIQESLISIVILPLVLVFFLCILALLPTWFQKEAKDLGLKFDDYWVQVGLFKKALLWYGAIFYSLGFIFLTFMTILILVMSVGYVL